MSVTAQNGVRRPRALCLNDTDVGHLCAWHLSSRAAAPFLLSPGKTRQDTGDLRLAGWRRAGGGRVPRARDLVAQTDVPTVCRAPSRRPR